MTKLRRNLSDKVGVDIAEVVGFQYSEDAQFTPPLSILELYLKSGQTMKVFNEEAREGKSLLNIWFDDRD